MVPIGSGSRLSRLTLEVLGYKFLMLKGRLMGRLMLCLPAVLGTLPLFVARVAVIVLLLGLMCLPITVPVVAL